MQDSTWLEPWQVGIDTEGCGAPISPHDGSNNAMWELDSTAKTLTITGAGAFIGLAKVFNGGELQAGYVVALSLTPHSFIVSQKIKH